MIDGIKLKTEISNFYALKNSIKVPFSTSISIDSGELRTTQKNGKITKKS